MAVCDYCGLEADVTITSDNKHSYTYPELECRFLQERASKPGGLQMFHAVECPHLVKAVEEEVAELRADDSRRYPLNGQVARRRRSKTLV